MDHEQAKHHSLGDRSIALVNVSLSRRIRNEKTKSQWDERIDKVNPALEKQRRERRAEERKEEGEEEGEEEKKEKRRDSVLAAFFSSVQRHGPVLWLSWSARRPSLFFFIVLSSFAGWAWPRSEDTGHLDTSTQVCQIRKSEQVRSQARSPSSPFFFIWWLPVKGVAAGQLNPA